MNLRPVSRVVHPKNSRRDGALGSCVRTCWLLLLSLLRYPAIWRLDKSDRWKKMFESYDYMPRHTTTTQRADSSRKLGRGVSGELYSVRWLVRHKRRIAGFSCSEIRTLYAAAMTTVPCRALCVAHMQLTLCPGHVLANTSHHCEICVSVPICTKDNDERQSPDFCLCSGRSTLHSSSSSSPHRHPSL